MRYEKWQEEIPEAVKCEGYWQLYGYRKALFLYDICWRDCEKLIRHALGRAVAEQLIRSAGSIPANIEEGYGRGYGRERLRFLRMALGSARETKGWYYRAKNVLSPTVLDHRLALISEVVALLVTELKRSSAQS